MDQVQDDAAVQERYASFRKWAEETLLSEYERLIAEDRSTANDRIRQFAKTHVVEVGKTEFGFPNVSYWDMDPEPESPERPRFAICTVLAEGDLHHEMDFVLRDLS